MDDLDDLIWGLLILLLGTAVVLFANGPSTGWSIMVGAAGAFCGLVLIGRMFLKNRD